MPVHEGLEGNSRAAPALPSKKAIAAAAETIPDQNPIRAANGRPAGSAGMSSISRLDSAAPSDMLGGDNLDITVPSFWGRRVPHRGRLRFGGKRPADPRLARWGRGEGRQAEMRPE